MTRFDTQNRGSMCTLTRFDTHKIFLKKTVNGGQLTEIYLEIDMFDTILYPLSFRWPQDICVRPCHCVSFRVIYRYAFRVIPCRSVSFQVKGVEFLRFLSKSKHPACTEVEGARLRLDAGSIYICRCRCLHCTRTDCNQRVAWLCMEVR